MTLIKVILFHLKNYKNVNYLNYLKNELLTNGYLVVDADLDYVNKSEYKTNEIMIVTDYLRCIHLCRKIQYKICLVENSDELSFDYVINYIKYYEKPNNGVLQKTFFKKKLNIVIKIDLDKKDFIVPRQKNNPLITINDRPLITWIIENIGIDGNYYFIVEMDPEFNDWVLENLLYSLVPDCKIIKVKKKLEGPACYLLEAEKYINNDYPIIISSDRQWVKWDCEEYLFNFLMRDKESLAHVITFLTNGSNKYSYVKVDQSDSVVSVRQFVPISCFGITGIYIWRSSKKLFKYIHQMISKNKRVKGEFYIATVLNELLEEISIDSKNIIDSYNKKLSDIEQKYIDKDVQKLHDQIVSEINSVETEMQKALKNTNRITKKECYEYKELNNLNDLEIFKNYLIEQKILYPF